MGIKFKESHLLGAAYEKRCYKRGRYCCGIGMAKWLKEQNKHAHYQNVGTDKYFQFKDLSLITCCTITGDYRYER